MKYDNPELIDKLASEYVLGTMHGRSRERFQRLMRERTDVQQAVWRWERELNSVASSMPPVNPSERVWRDISQRLQLGQAEPRQVKSWWRAWGLVSTFTSLVLAALLIVTPITREPTHFAQFADDDAAPLWVISADLVSGRLSAKAVNVQAAQLDQVFELWMLPDGGQPRSLGLLPVGSARSDHDIPAALGALLARTSGLAISIEPPGGSPTGVPTGPVVYQARMVTM